MTEAGEGCNAPDRSRTFQSPSGIGVNSVMQLPFSSQVSSATGQGVAVRGAGAGSSSAGTPASAWTPRLVYQLAFIFVITHSMVLASVTIT